ncbi:MAG: hypothetical protein QXU98_14390, partial [Candidatus Parvarchaeota archaeon]
TTENIFQVISDAMNQRARQVTINATDGTTLSIWINEVQEIENTGDLIRIKLKNLRSRITIYYKGISDIEISRSQRAFKDEVVVFEDEGEEIAL